MYIKNERITSNSRYKTWRLFF